MSKCQVRRQRNSAHPRPWLNFHGCKDLNPINPLCAKLLHTWSFIHSLWVWVCLWKRDRCCSVYAHTQTSTCSHQTAKKRVCWNILHSKYFCWPHWGTTELSEQIWLYWFQAINFTFRACSMSKLAQFQVGPTWEMATNQLQPGWCSTYLAPPPKYLRIWAQWQQWAAAPPTPLANRTRTALGCWRGWEQKAMHIKAKLSSIARESLLIRWPLTCDRSI